jgi:hypothetical protein
MYDVLNFGCIPVVLSDDLVWAFSLQTGGFLNHSHFSIQIPQCVVQLTTKELLIKYSKNTEKFGFLPLSGKYIYDLLNDSYYSNNNNSNNNNNNNNNGYNGEYSENGVYINPLVQILTRVPKFEIEFLQKNIAKIASNYQYYKMYKNLTYIPTAKHFFPDGKALKIITNMLSIKKKYGIKKLKEDCELEKNSTKHKYINRYTCESFNSINNNNNNKIKNKKDIKSKNKNSNKKKQNFK